MSLKVFNAVYYFYFFQEKENKGEGMLPNLAGIKLSKGFVISLYI